MLFEQMTDRSVYLALIANIPAVTWLSDETGKTLFISNNVKQVYGYTPEEIYGAEEALWFGRIHPDDIEQVQKKYSNLLDRSEPFDLEYRIQRRDGKWIWLHDRALATCENEGAKYAYGVFLDITERKQAEEALRASEERYRLLFERNLAGVFLTAFDGRFIDCNESLARILGCDSREDVLSRNALSIFHHPADLDKALALLQEDGSLTGFEICLRKKDGSPVWVLTNLNLLAPPHGAPAMIVGTIIDITERKRAHEAVRKSESELRVVWESALDGMRLTDGEGIVHRVNEAYCRLVGKPREALEGHPMSVVHTEARQTEVLEKHRQRFRERNIPPHLERKITLWNGKTLHLELSNAFLTLPGQKDLVLSVFRDLTENKQAEAKIAERTAYLDALIEHTPLAIVAIDLKGVMQLCNPAFEQLFQYRQSETLGVSIDSLVATEDLMGEAVGITRRVTAGETVCISTCRRRKDGKLVDVDLHAVPLIVGGKLVGAYAIYRDLTEQKILEAQLRQAKRMEALGLLAGGVAHAYNNLLLGMVGYSELLMNQLDASDPRRKYVEEIHSAGERASSLTRQLLAFSRKQILKPEVLDLNAVVSQASKMLRRFLGEDIEIESRLEPSLGRVRADAAQLEQVILNLAINARDAMPGGGKIILQTRDVEIEEGDVGQRADLLPGRYVMLAVTDTGSGMDRETQSHIFEPFFTTKGSTHRTGLGLATVEGIVKQSDGHIWVDSELGRGTTFTIYLPRTEESFEVSKRRSSLRLPFPGFETVLVVDDEDVVRSVIRDFLERHGYTVLEAREGMEALELWQKHKGEIHLLLTDVVMPGMNGPELARQLLALRPGLRVLYMSGYTDSAHVHDSIFTTGAAYLQKPFSMDLLLRKVHEVLDVGGRKA